MQRATQTEEQLIKSINVAVANDWRHTNHHCLVSRLKKHDGAGCNWLVDISNCGGASVAHREECTLLIERTVSVLSAKYNVAWL